jgi:alpha-methylacyl-CoA racemase
VRYLATMPMLLTQLSHPMWTAERGANVLDGGAPFYDTYKTKDGRYMSMCPLFANLSDRSGSLEPRFYAALLKGLELDAKRMPDRDDRGKWPELRRVFTERFLEKTQEEWENVFDGTDACVTAVVPLSSDDNRPIANLSSSPSLPVENPKVEILKASTGAKQVLKDWVEWRPGKDYQIDGNGTVSISNSAKL